MESRMSVVKTVGFGWRDAPIEFSFSQCQHGGAFLQHSSAKSSSQSILLLLCCSIYGLLLLDGGRRDRR